MNTVDGEGNPVEKSIMKVMQWLRVHPGSSFILNQQSISFNDNGTPEDDAIDIAIGRKTLTRH